MSSKEKGKGKKNHQIELSEDDHDQVKKTKTTPLSKNLYENNDFHERMRTRIRP